MTYLRASGLWGACYHHVGDYASCVMDPVALQMHTSTSPYIPQIPYPLVLWGLLLKTTPKQLESSAGTGSHTSKNVASQSDWRYDEENVNKKQSAT